MLTSDAVKEKARSLGIDVVGITNAEPFARFTEQVERSIASGRISLDNLRYEQILREHSTYAEPRNSLPDALSIVVIGIRYLIASTPDEGIPSAPRGNIGRMHWRDFFGLLDEKRDELVRFLHENGAQVAEESRVPVKAAAHRAGVGVYGKNTIIQNEDFGSWVLYRAIVTDLPLKPDDEGEPRCGSCQRCLRLCPVKALVEPYAMSPARCLNHILAAPGSIPLEYREAIGNRINSCDVCQEVCPRNTYVDPVITSAKEDWGEWTKDPPLLALLDLTDAQFEANFARLDWHVPKLDLLKRNVLIALGNIGDRSVLPKLLNYAGGEDGVLAEHAAWAIENINKRFHQE